MSDLLPVLQSNAAPMSLCTICADPGHCCRGFELSSKGERLTYWKSEWREKAQAYLVETGLPFVVVRIDGEYKSDEGDEYVTVWYRCPEVTESGLCGIYETRPGLCRRFLPGSGDLCVMTNLSARRP
jgi:Fe-S-cluster containining protein